MTDTVTPLPTRRATCPTCRGTGRVAVPKVKPTPSQMQAFTAALRAAVERARAGTKS